MSISREYAALLDERIAIDDELVELVGDGGRELMSRCAELRGKLQVAVEDRVLRIAGELCLQYEAPELFERIYALTLEGCRVEPGDGLRWLRECRAEALVE